MGALTNTKRSVTYADLLQLGNGGAGLNSFLTVQDGLGNATALNLGPTNTTLSTESNFFSLLSGVTLTCNASFTTERLSLLPQTTISSSSPQTITNAATLAIAGAPIAAGSLTITNPYSFWVQSGVTRLDSDVLFGTNQALIQGSSGNVFVNSAAQVAWSSTSTVATGGSGDTGLARARAATVKPTDGVASLGWLWQAAGRKKVASTVTNATNTMSSLSDLGMGLQAGITYTGLLVIVANNSTAAEGLAFDFNGGSATMSGFGATFASAPATSVTFGTVTTAALGTALTITTATTTNNTYIIMLSLVVNQAGTFIPRFAENSAHVSGTATVSSVTFMWLEPN